MPHPTRRTVRTAACWAALAPAAAAQEPPALPTLQFPSLTPAGGAPLPNLAPAPAKPLEIPSLPPILPAPAPVPKSAAPAALAAPAPKPPAPAVPTLLGNQAAPPLVIPLPDEKPKPPAFPEELAMPKPAEKPTIPALPVAAPTPDAKEKSLRAADPAPTVEKGAAPAPTVPAAPGAFGDAPVTLLPPRQLALAVAAGVALSGTPLAPAQAADPATQTADVSDLKKQVADLQKDLKAANTILYGTGDGTGADGVMRTLKAIEGKLDGLTSRLDQLEKRVDGLNRSTSASSPVVPGVPAPMTPAPGAASTAPLLSGGRSTVRVVNEYPVEVSLLVNDKSYRVPPNDTRLIDVGAGSYKYELLQSGAQPVTSTIRDGETVTLRIR